MSELTTEAVTIISSLAETSGLSVFLWFLLKGLRTQIANLNQTIEAQKRTLEAQGETLKVQKDTLTAMEARIAETEKVGDLYRKLLQDLPNDIEQYRKTLASLKDGLIKELEEANRQKDDKLKEFSRKQLDEITTEERILEELPSLRDQLISAMGKLESSLDNLDLLQPDSPLRRFLSVYEDFEKRRQPRDVEVISVEVQRVLPESSDE